MLYRSLLATTVALAGLFVTAAPAVASSGNLECDSSARSHVLCDLYRLGSPAGLTNQRWSYNNIALASANDKNVLSVGCGSDGTAYTIKVTYTDANGVAQQDSASGSCHSGNP